MRAGIPVVDSGARQKGRAGKRVEDIQVGWLRASDRESKQWVHRERHKRISLFAAAQIRGARAQIQREDLARVKHIALVVHGEAVPGLDAPTPEDRNLLRQEGVD